MAISKFLIALALGYSFVFWKLHELLNPQSPRRQHLLILLKQRGLRIQINESIRDLLIHTGSGSKICHGFRELEHLLHVCLGLSGSWEQLCFVSAFKGVPLVSLPLPISCADCWSR